jgi:hypothetical protein
MTKPRVSFRGRRKKGDNYNRLVLQEICGMLGLLYGEDLKKRPMGDPGDDCLHLTEKAKIAFPFSVEVKNDANWKITKWWSKLAKDIRECRIPMMILKHQDLKEDFVLIRLHDFLEILERERKLSILPIPKADGATNKKIS